MERTSIYLPHGLKYEVKAAAQRKGLSQAEVIRQALVSYLNDPANRRPRPQTIGMISSGEVPASEFEDWLAENLSLD